MVKYIVCVFGLEWVEEWAVLEQMDRDKRELAK